MHDFNLFVQNHPNLESAIFPLRDGLTVIKYNSPKNDKTFSNWFFFLFFFHFSFIYLFILFLEVAAMTCSSFTLFLLLFLILDSVTVFLVDGRNHMEWIIFLKFHSCWNDSRKFMLEWHLETNVSMSMTELKSCKQSLKEFPGFVALSL